MRRESFCESKPEAGAKQSGWAVADREGETVVHAGLAGASVSRIVASRFECLKRLESDGF